MNAGHIEAFLSHLATEQQVAASTQNQALNALVFLYNKVLEKDVGSFDHFVRAKRPKRLPVVLSRKEVAQLLDQMKRTEGLVARILYGSGLRLSEALRLRVKDVDFNLDQILFDQEKGGKTAAPSCRTPCTFH